MFLLDTNVVSELRSGKPRQSAAVRAWAQTQPIQRLYLSAITRMERKDQAQDAVLRKWSEAALHEFLGRVLRFPSLTGRRCAGLHVPNQRSFRDSTTAATTLEHRFTVVTCNVGDFTDAGVILVDPLAEGSADS